MSRMNTRVLSGEKIALLQGGPGSERPVSLKSAESVAVVLNEAGAEVIPVDVSDENFVLPDGTTLGYIMIHGTFGEDGQLQAELEKRGIPFTGAGVESSRLAFDKVASKIRFAEAGVPTPKFEIIDVASGETPSFTAPFVVKPPQEGSSVGVHVVKTQAEVGDAIADARKYADKLLVEAFVEGRELTVGILDDTALPVVEIQPQDGFYDMTNKYPWMGGGGGSEYTCPAEIGEEATKRVQEAALAAHRSLGCEVYSRVDVLLPESGEPMVLEANTIPGMTESSLLPKSAAAAGIDFGELCARIAQLSKTLRSPA